VHVARFTWIVLSLCSQLAMGQTVDTDSRSAQLARDRAAAEARYQRAAQACEKAFAQTACVDDARRERRREVGRLDAERSALDLADRQRRAADRNRRVEAKQRAAAQRSTEPAPPAASKPRAMHRAGAASAGERGHAKTPRGAAPAASTASGRLAARDKRMADAEAHAAAVKKRNADRAAKRAAAAPLPAASVPAPSIR
jgi:hypothetical protein